MAMDSSRPSTTPQERKFLNGGYMIWTLWKPSRPNNGGFMRGWKRQRRNILAGARPALVLVSFLILSGTATAQETPGYGVSGYFSLEAEGGSAIRVAPRPPTGR